MTEKIIKLFLDENKITFKQIYQSDDQVIVTLENDKGEYAETSTFIKNEDKELIKTLKKLVEYDVSGNLPF